VRLKPAAFRPVFSRVTLSRRLGRTQGIGAFTETLDGLVGPPPSVTTRSLIDRQCVESKRGKHRPNHCVFPAIGTGFGEKDGAICACPSRTREKPFPTLFPWGSRARVQHRDCCRLSTPIGGRSRRTKASKQKNPLFLLLRGADAAAHGKVIAPRSCLGIAQASIESPFVIRA
jgi:hypothetical protein